MAIELKDMIEKLVSDPYERQARLYPALLAFSPIFIMVTSFYHDKLNVVNSAVVLLIMSGLIVLISNISRTIGRSVESKLWTEWGGMPSVVILRHKDSYINSVEKKRYHVFLEKKLRLVFPSQSIEDSNLEEADSIYKAASNYLRTHTRDTEKFKLLFKENIAYGFRRNSYGIRLVGMLCSVLVVFWIFIRKNYSVWSERLAVSTDPESFFTQAEILSLSWAIIMFLVWVFYFNKSVVREAAFCYANQLIMTCDLLEKESGDD